jgi:hypothetical protein
MGKREKPQPVSWKSQLSPPSSHLSIVIAYFFYRCTAVRTSSNSSVSPEIAIRATMNNDRSSGGSSNGTTPPPSAGNDHEVAPPPPYPTFGGLLDAEVSFDGEQGPPVRSAGPAGLAGSVGLRQRLPDTDVPGFTTPGGIDRAASATRLARAAMHAPGPRTTAPPYRPSIEVLAGAADTRNVNVGAVASWS